MQIPSYQIHNVLNVYGKQLGHEEPSSKDEKPGDVRIGERVELSLEGRRKAIADKVASDIIARITQFGPEGDTVPETASRAEGETGKPVDGHSQKDSFVFNVIDEDNQKKTREFSLEDSSFLISRMETLAQNGG